MNTYISSYSLMRSIQWYREANKEQKSALIAGWIGWGLDAFDNLIYSFTMYVLIEEWSLDTVTSGLVASCTLISSALGGIFFGIASDRVGRMKMLTVTVLIYSMATGFCGLAQNISQLLAIRIIVGLGVGGEWTTGATLISESWSNAHRGKALSIMQSGYAIGAMLAAWVSGPIIAAYGWRYLYFIGVLPALLVFYIRRNVKEPELWIKKVQSKTFQRQREIPLVSIFRSDIVRKTLLGSVFSTFLQIVSMSMQTWTAVFLATPIAKGGAGMSIIDSSIMIFPQFLGSLFGYMLFGFASDKYGRKKVFIGFLLLSAITCPLLIYSARISILFYILISFAYGAFAVGIFAGMGPLLAEQYPTKIRGTGVGFCFNIGKISGALAVTIVGMFIGAYGIGNVLSFLGIFFLLSLICILFFQETSGKELE